MQETYCIFSANYLPNIGGVEKYTQNLAFALEELGKKAIIVTNNCFNLTSYENVSANISIYRLPCYPLFNGRFPLPKKNADYKKLLKQLNEEKINYISINTRFYPHTFTGVKLAEHKGIKPIVVDHGSAYLTFGNKVADVFVRAWEHVVTTLLKRHDIDFYTVSEAGLHWLTNFNIAGKGVLNNSIDTVSFRKQSSHRNFRDELNLTESDFIVSFIGRFIPEKGIIPLAEAAQQLQSNSNIRFLLAGDGPLKNAIKEYRLRNVHLLGKINSNDVAALLETSDCFCLPTRSEGFSTSLLEAAACETTSVITHVGGVDELMPTNEYGIIIDNTSPEIITQAILELYNDPELNKKMAAKIHARVMNEFSWKKTAEKTISACHLANKRN